MKAIATGRSRRGEAIALSALGALLDAEGTWITTPDDVDLENGVTSRPSAATTTCG